MSNRLGGALWKNRINYKVRYLFWGSARFPKFDLLTAIVLVLEWPSNYGLLWWLVCYIKREGIYINLFCFMVLRKTNFYIWPSNCHQILFLVMVNLNNMIKSGKNLNSVCLFNVWNWIIDKSKDQTQSIYSVSLILSIAKNRHKKRAMKNRHVGNVIVYVWFFSILFLSQILREIGVKFSFFLHSSFFM